MVYSHIYPVVSGGYMGHRKGGKFGGDHTTLIDVSTPLVDAAADLPEVHNISIGFITMIKNRQESSWLIKLEKREGCVFAVAMQKASKQELYFYTSDPQTTLVALARWVVNSGYKLKFHDNAKDRSAMPPKQRKEKRRRKRKHDDPVYPGFIYM